MNVPPHWQTCDIQKSHSNWNAEDRRMFIEDVVLVMNMQVLVPNGIRQST